jgi:hypothetical protein
MLKLQSQDYGGLLEISRTWKVISVISCFKAAVRFTMWFSIKKYIQGYSMVKRFYDLFSTDLQFVGLVPVDSIGVFLDILPEIITMLVGLIVKYRVQMVRYSDHNKERIMKEIVVDQFTGDIDEVQRKVTQLGSILSNKHLIPKSDADAELGLLIKAQETVIQADADMIMQENMSK